MDECSTFLGISHSWMIFCDHDRCTAATVPFAAEREPFRTCLAAVAVACPFAEWPLPAACALPLPLPLTALSRRVAIAGRWEGDARAETGDWERRALERKGSLEGSPRRSWFRLSWKASLAGIMLRCGGGEVARWGRRRKREEERREAHAVAAAQPRQGASASASPFRASTSYAHIHFSDAQASREIHIAIV